MEVLTILAIFLALYLAVGINAYVIGVFTCRHMSWTVRPLIILLWPWVYFMPADAVGDPKYSSIIKMK